jgi:hypothetical protein
MVLKEGLQLPTYIDRTAFLHEFWDYKPGQHVTFLAPTQAGKTTFMAQLAGVTCTPELPGVMLVMKPRDKTVDKIIRELDFKRIATWPPKPAMPWDKKIAGWALWPKHTFDVDVDDENMKEQFGKALLDCYKKGDRIVMADETFGLVAELDLTKKLNAIWTRGASMGCGLWAATQRPAFIPQNAYVQAEHVFLAYDPDVRSRKRYGEIGGVDPKMIEATVVQLEKYNWLYIRRTGRVSAIIGA